MAHSAASSPSTSPTFSSATTITDFSAASPALEIRAVQLGTYWYVVGVNDKQQIVINEAPIRGFAKTGAGDPSKLTNWDSTTVEPDNSDGTLNYLTAKRLGVVPMDDAVLVFWVDTENNRKRHVEAAYSDRTIVATIASTNGYR